MLSGDLINLSLRQIYRNRRRYRGAIIGISLGIAVLITVLTIGESVESTLGKNLEILGTATIVKATWDFGRTQRWHYGQYYLSDVASLEAIPEVTAVAPVVWAWDSNVLRKKKKTSARLFGINPTFFRVLYLPVGQGRELTDEDVALKRHVCIIGDKIEEKLFQPEENKIGERIAFQGMTFEIVGLLGVSEEKEFRETILLPISTARAKFSGMHEIGNVYVRAQSWDSVARVHKEVDTVLKRNQPDYAAAISVQSFTERIKAIQTIVFVFKFFLFAAIIVTLILGALGIMNVMLAVVSERTKEIGLRKAVGATESMILYQFMCEALCVGLLGATAGIVMGATAVHVLSDMLGIQGGQGIFLVSLGGSVFIGVLLGVISGAFPARRASRLDAVDAMRFE
ncbi:MAG: ABC transporter permease [Pseudomonadota bacterium]